MPLYIELRLKQQVSRCPSLPVITYNLPSAASSVTYSPLPSSPGMRVPRRHETALQHVCVDVDELRRIVHAQSP